MPGHYGKGNSGIKKDGKSSMPASVKKVIAKKKTGKK